MPTYRCNNSYSCLLLLAKTALIVSRMSSVASSPSSYLCPANCSCSHANSAGGVGKDWTTTIKEATTLTVQCPTKSEDTGERLERELDELLAHLPQLTSLTINSSPLEHLPSALCRLHRIISLNMASNCLREIRVHCLAQMTNMTIFIADSNFLQFLPDGVFDGLENLERVSLEFNQIGSIGLNVFATSSNLPRLNYISLMHNAIEILEPWPLMRGLALNATVTVLLDFNPIRNFSNHVGWRYSCREMRGIDMFLSMTRIKMSRFTDFFNGWNLTLKDILCIAGFGNAHTRFVSVLQSQNFICDCVDYDYYKAFLFPKRASLLEGLQCREPLSLYAAPVSRIHLEQFICNYTYTDRCIFACQCVAMPYERTFKVVCPKLRKLPVQLPPTDRKSQRYHLDFSGSSLARLEPRSYFGDAKYIDVSRSELETVDAETWRQLVNSTSTLYVHGNLHTSLPVDAVATTPVNNIRLSLHDNPWDCYCGDRWMKNWIVSLKEKLDSSEGILCRRPDRLKGRNILQIPDDEFCNDPVKQVVAKWVSVSVSIVGGIVLLAVGFTLVLYRLRIRVYASFQLHPFDKDECFGEEMDYDVFIWYSNKDEEVAKDLISSLDALNYRVGDHSRYYIPGALISENNDSCIARSKRTVCLLSDNFLASGYCMDEIRSALEHDARIRKHRLMVVKMKNISLDDDENCAKREVIAYVKQHTYLEYSARDMLARLCYWLPIQKLGVEFPEQHARAITSAVLDAQIMNEDDLADDQNKDEIDDMLLVEV